MQKRTLKMYLDSHLLLT